MLLVGAVFLSAPSFAQNMNSMDSRLDRIERDMQTLSRSVYKGDVPPPEMGYANSGQNNAQMELRLNQIEDQLRRLTGMIEENTFRIRQIESNQVSSNQPAMQQQIPSQVQPVLSAPNGGDSSLSVSNQPYQLGTLNNNSPATTPAGLYDQAFSYLQNNDYASAQASFNDFIIQYPEHSLVANAKYWLGETYYKQNNFKQASQAFARSFKDHPDGQKAPDTLLELAMSLHAQNMNNEACLTLSELSKRFPNAPTPVTSQADQERSQYGCS